MTDTHLQPPSLGSGQEFAGCRIIQSIGQSETAEVYLAETIRVREPVALKVVCADVAVDGRPKHFLAELKRWSRFQHPNLLHIHRVGEAHGLPFVVMQYVSGETFDELVQERGGRLPWRSAVRMIQLAARGLHFLHDGMLHHDIRPSNMILTPVGDVVLLEFDLMADEDVSSFESFESAKMAFRSPEQCRREPVDRRSDVYGLGATLYYLLTGELPFSGSAGAVSRRIAEGETPPPVDCLNPEVPSAVARFVARMMAVGRDDRPRDAAAVVRQCRKFLKEFPIPLPRRRRRTGLAGTPLQLTRPGELLPLESPWESLRPKVWLGTTIAVLATIALVTCGIMLAS